jgi:hypothetical protein
MGLELKDEFYVVIGDKRIDFDQESNLITFHIGQEFVAFYQNIDNFKIFLKEFKKFLSKDNLPNTD